MSQITYPALLLAIFFLVAGCATHTPPRAETASNGPNILAPLQQALSHGAFNEKLQELDIGPDERFASSWQVAGNHETHRDVAFAEELEQFLGNRLYRCQRPLLYRYFAGRFGRPDSETKCENGVPFRVTSGIEGRALRWVNPERVKAIHVLFAGPGNGIVSRFGHLSFRLIVCPDNRSGPACDENVYEHLVLGYRAHVDDQKINYWSGLTGDYRSHLFANTFMDVYREYAIGEFRDLYSLPLELSPQQTRQIVRELAEIHWSYAGEYRFLNNNCSSIAQRYLLHSPSPLVQDPRLQRIRWRPDGFFKHLRQSPYSSEEVLSNLERAERQGYFFPSTRPAYEEAIALLNAERPDVVSSSLSEYLATPALMRLNALRDNADYLTTLQREPRLMEAQRLLDELAFIRIEKNLLAELSYYFSENTPEHLGRQLQPHTTPEQFRAFQQCIMQPVLEAFQPRHQESGIPVEGPLRTPTDNTVCSRENTQARLRETIQILGEIDAEDWSRVDRVLRQWAGSLEVISILSQLAGDY